MTQQLTEMEQALSQGVTLESQVHITSGVMARLRARLHPILHRERAIDLTTAGLKFDASWVQPSSLVHDSSPAQTQPEAVTTNSSLESKGQRLELLDKVNQKLGEVLKRFNHFLDNVANSFPRLPGTGPVLIGVGAAAAVGAAVAFTSLPTSQAPLAPNVYYSVQSSSGGGSLTPPPMGTISSAKVGRLVKLSTLQRAGCLVLALYAAIALGLIVRHVIGSAKPPSRTAKAGRAFVRDTTNATQRVDKVNLKYLDPNSERQLQRNPDGSEQWQRASEADWDEVEPFEDICALLKDGHINPRDVTTWKGDKYNEAKRIYLGLAVPPPPGSSPSPGTAPNRADAQQYISVRKDPGLATILVHWSWEQDHYKEISDLFRPISTSTLLNPDKWESPELVSIRQTYTLLNPEEQRECASVVLSFHPGAQSLINHWMSGH